MTARTDTFRIRQARWSEGRLEVQGLDLGNVSMTGTWNAPSDSLTPHQSRTASSWPASLKLVSLDLVGWKSLAWSHDSTAAAASSGSLAEVLVGPKRVELGSMNLSGAWGKSPLMPDTVILGPSHLHGRWSPESWHVQSKGLDLPGLRFEGALSWPEREGNGSAELTWDLLAPWAEALDVLSLFNELELNGGQTSATWNLKNASWNASLSGPDWLSAEASGTPYSWNASVHAQRIPATYQASLPCTQLTWQAQGTPAACSWSLVGDSSVRVTGTARTTDGWWEALPSSLPVADLSFDVELWGRFFRSSDRYRKDDRRMVGSLAFVAPCRRPLLRRRTLGSMDFNSGRKVDRSGSARRPPCHDARPRAAPGSPPLEVERILDGPCICISSGGPARPYSFRRHARPHGLGHHHPFRGSPCPFLANQGQHVVRSRHGGVERLGQPRLVFLAQSSAGVGPCT